MKQKDWRKWLDKFKKEYEDKPWCEYCSSKFALSFHHIVRRSKGGTNDPDNIVLLCAKCHHRADNASGHKEFNNKLKELKGDHHAHPEASHPELFKSE